MFAKLIALVADHHELVEFATGNTLFGLSAALLVAVGGWVLLMRRKHDRM